MGTVADGAAARAPRSSVPAPRSALGSRSRMSDSLHPAEDSSGRHRPPPPANVGRPTCWSSAVPGSSARTSSTGSSPSGAAVEVVDDLSSGSLANLADARASAPRSGGELHIHTLDAASPDLATMITLRRPRHIVHLALLVPAANSRHRARAVVHVDARRARRRPRRICRKGRRAAAGDGAVRHPVGTPAPGQGGRDHATRRAGRRRQGDRRAVDDVPRGARHRVHGAGGDHRLRSRASRPERGAVARLLDAAANGEPARLTGDGRQTRDFVHVDDVVDALVRSLQRGSGLVVNVGTGVQTSLRDARGDDRRSAHRRRSSPRRPGELGRFCVSPVRARIHLGWAPWTTLAEGLAALRDTP